MVPSRMGVGVLTVAVAAGAVAASCQAPEVLVADLVPRFSESRRQPSNKAFAIETATFDGTPLPAIRTTGQTRLTFHVTVPDAARFRSSVGLVDASADPASGIVFLVGASDGHVYRELRSTSVPAAGAGHWRQVDVSLEEYAGLTIDLILNTRSASDTGGPPTGLWGAPVVVVR